MAAGYVSLYGGVNVGNMLNYVDKQIHEDGVNRLKLLLYAVLEHAWKELDECEKPSKIYRMLEAHLGSEEEAMQMFLFALKAIGGSKRGKQTAKEAAQILGPDHIPNELDFEQQTEKFRFFFWLLKVARRLPKECHERLTKHFAKTEKVNHRFIKGIPQLFIQLYQDRVLSEADTSSLMKVLEGYETGYGQDTFKRKDIQKCMTYLHKFSDSEADPFSSGDEESSASSMYETDAYGQKIPSSSKSKCGPKKRQKKVPESTSTPTQFHLESTDDADLDGSTNHNSSINGNQVPGNHGVEESQLFQPKSGAIPCAASVGAALPSLESVGQPTEAISNYQPITIHASESVATDNPVGDVRVIPVTICLCFTRRCTIIVLSILVSLAVVCTVSTVAVSSKYVWSPLHQLSSASYEAKQREGNTPILGEINSFLTQQISVQEDVTFGDSSHNISVFIADETCNDLPTTNTWVVYNKDQLSIDPVYMLEESQIAMYNICASTNSSESNPIALFILKGMSEFINFNPRDKNDYYKFYTVKVGKSRRKRCIPIAWKITENDYYSVKIVRPSAPAITLSYNLTMHIRSLDIAAMNKSLISVGAIEPDDDSQETSKVIPFGTKKYCLFAEIENTTMHSTSNYTSLRVVFQPRHTASLGITISVTAVFIVILLVLITTEVCICYKYRSGTYSRIV